MHMGLYDVMSLPDHALMHMLRTICTLNQAYAKLKIIYKLQSEGKWPGSLKLTRSTDNTWITNGLQLGC